MYALVKDGKVIAKGSKRDMTSKMKKEGGKIFNAPSKKVGDTMKEGLQLDEKAGDIPDLKKLVSELQGASKMHLAQSKRVQAHVDMMVRADATSW